MEFIIKTSHRKRSLAFFLACTVYALFLMLILVKIQITQKKEGTPVAFKKHSTALPFTPRMRDKGPAPVRFITQPKTITPQPTPQKPIEQKIIKEQQVPQQKTAPKVSPSLKKTQNKSPLEKKPTEENSIPRYKKRSKNKWFKKQHKNNIKTPTPPLQTTTQPINIASQLTQGFRNYVVKKRAEEAAYSVPKTTGSTESLEYEMFIGKMVHAVCDASHLNPLTPHTPLVQSHTITISITCDKNRTISDFSFVQPSYDNQLNDYLKSLVLSIIPPQIPTIHPAPKITIPLRITIARQYYTHDIRLLPA